MKKVFFLLTLLWLSHTGWAQTSYQPTVENRKAREQFQDEKFGIFLHWGLYSMLARGEWVMHNEDINFKEYAKLAQAFYPSRFNADSWVKAIRDGGAKYITITTRHHDGFSLFKTATSTYNSVDGTPFKRDIIKELAEACARYGVKLHLYYSHLDWGREDYPQGRTGNGTGRDKTKANWPSYYQFMNTQLTELLTHYGPVGAIWFDGWWDHDSDAKPFDWQLPEQYALIHQLQPQCLIGNNHHQTPYAGEDIQIFERDFQGKALGNYPWNRAKPSTTIGAIPSPTTIIKRPKRLSKCWYVRPERMPICCSTSDLNPMATCPLWHSTAFMPSENGSNNTAQPSITRAEDSWHPMIGA